MTKKLLIATREKGKVEEIKQILKNLNENENKNSKLSKKLNLKLVSLTDIKFNKKEPTETGKTYAENAIIKAKYYGDKTKLLTLADDSGLEVKALPNKLGIKSKRYAKGSDQQRNQKLLKEMKNIPNNKRQAQFTASLALYNPNNNKLNLTQGIDLGKISTKPKGKHGFGYDPIFIVNSLNKHFSQITLKEKNNISHRAVALKKMIKYL